MGKKKQEQVSQMLLYNIRDLEEIRQLTDKLDTATKSVKILADGLRHAHESHREMVQNQIQAHREMSERLESMLKRCKELAASCGDVEQVQFVDLEARFEPVEDPENHNGI